MPHQHQHAQWNWARLGTVSQAAIGLGLGLMELGDDVRIQVLLVLISYDAMRCDPIRVETVLCQCRQQAAWWQWDNGRRTRDSGTLGQWDIGRSYDHAYTMWIIFQRRRGAPDEKTQWDTSHKRPRQTLSQPEQSSRLPNHLTSFQDVVVAHVIVVVVAAAAAAATVLAKVQVRIWVNSVGGMYTL